MVKIKKNNNIQKISNSNNYQIKTRNKDKKLCSMSREIKNLQEAQWMPNSAGSITKLNTSASSGSSGTSTQVKQRTLTRFSKNFRKIKNKKELKLKKNIKLKKIKQNDLKTNNIYNNDHQTNLAFSKNSKKNKNNHKTENVRKMSNDIYKYIYKGIEYFELKEILGFLYDDLNIDLDSDNNNIKDKEEFKLEMNEMLKKFFVIYYNKILITPNNLFLFLNYLSKYITFDTKEILKLLYKKCKTQVIEENITLDHYFKPTLFLAEK
jgi:hypothetical protein